MKKRKQAKDWYISATHFLTAGFILPLLINLIAGLVLSLLGIKSIVLISIIATGIWVLAIWLGVMYSANYLKKTYIIRDKDVIAKLSTIYYIVFRFSFIVIGFLSAIELTMFEILFEIVNSVFVIVLFYLFSEKYIVATEALSGQKD